MNPRQVRTLCFGLIAVALVLSFLSVASAQQAVVHPAVQEREISRSSARALFGMRMRSWPDGLAVRVFVLSDRSEDHKEFVKTQLDVYPHQLRQAWNRLVYSGTGQAPIRVGSVEEMLERVRSTPGALGYLPEELIDDSVRVLRID